MYFYEISNFIKYGQADYKGLDKDKNIGGSQVSYSDNKCVLVNEELIENSNLDLKLITEEEYNIIVEQIKTLNSEKRLSIEEQIANINVALANIMGV